MHGPVPEARFFIGVHDAWVSAVGDGIDDHGLAHLLGDFIDIEQHAHVLVHHVRGKIRDIVDAADMGGAVDDMRGPESIQLRPGRRQVQEITTRGAAEDGNLHPRRFEFVPHIAANKAGAAKDGDTMRQCAHGQFPFLHQLATPFLK